MTPTKSLDAQVKAVEHALEVLRQDEEVTSGLAGARLALMWTLKNAAAIKAAASVEKIPNGIEFILEALPLAQRPGAIALLRQFILLSETLPELDEILPLFAAVNRQHPSIVQVLEAFKGRVHVNCAELGELVAPQHANESERAHAG